MWQKKYKRQQEYYYRNIKKCCLRSIKYRIENKEKCREYKKEWKRKKRIEYLREHKDEIEKKKEFKKIIGRKKAIKRQLRYYNKNKINPIFRLNYQMGTRIWNALKKEKMGRSWKKLLGYTIKDLKRHLEKQFTSEMNWENWGKYWEIDHKIPKSWFKYLKAEDEEFKKCWGLENLQPLELSENRHKKNYFKS